MMGLPSSGQIFFVLESARVASVWVGFVMWHKSLVCFVKGLQGNGLGSTPDNPCSWLRLKVFVLVYEIHVLLGHVVEIIVVKCIQLCAVWEQYNTNNILAPK